MISRSCSAAADSGGPTNRIALADLRETPAFALLGEPGMGKTTAFEQEARALGTGAEFFSARDFLTFDLAEQPGIGGKVLFIDGLDEVRSGSGDPRGPLDQVRAKLVRMGNPSFRVSCRPADWLGKNDRENLAKVSPDSNLSVYLLDPLTDSQAELLLPRFGIKDPKAFVSNARQRNAHGLLGNPQSLELLARFVAKGGVWPHSNRELFEQACSRLALEQNADHRVSGGHAPTADLLDAAGYLCSMLLISGRDFLQLDPSAVSDAELLLDECSYEPREHLKSALATRLFKANEHNCFEPTHRRVAEFLAGRYLASLIRQCHPIKRILALIAGHDGGIASSLRGLSAWLATLAPIARAELIERDPVGVGLYGDLAAFTAGEKTDLIEMLAVESSSLYAIRDRRAAFSSLVGVDTESAVCEFLANRNPDSAGEAVAGFVLDLVPDQPHLPNLESRLRELLSAHVCASEIRGAALGAYLRNVPNSPEKTDALNHLLGRITSGAISDPVDELRGALLSELYPNEVAATEIWDHLIECEIAFFGGKYWRFWERDLLRGSKPSDMAVLLDEYHLRAERLLPVLHSRGFRGLPTRLLAEGLRAVGDCIDPARLHNWLSTGLNSAYPGSYRVDDEEGTIKEWLEKRPQVQLAISSECLKSWPIRGKSFQSFHTYSRCLRGSRPPKDYGTWCLSQVAEFADSEPQIALMLLNVAVERFRTEGPDSGLSIADLERQCASHDYLATALQRTLVGPTHPEIEDSSSPADVRPPEDPEKTEWLSQLRNRTEELRANQGSPADLYALGRAAFGLFGIPATSDSPRGRLAEFLENDEDLVGTALAALRGAPFREDVPEVAATLKLRSQSRISFLDFAVLAGIGEIESSNPESIYELTDRQLRNAVAIYLCAPGGLGIDPPWFRSLLNKRVDIVADVACRYFTAELRNRQAPTNLAYFLAHRPEYAELARLIGVRLLRSFPVRCNLAQVQVLEQLLLATLMHCDREELSDAISSKLGSKTMLPAPRARFMMIAAILGPDKNVTLLKATHKSNRAMAKHLVEFLNSIDVFKALQPMICAPVAQALIEIIGATSGSRADSDLTDREFLTVRHCVDLLRSNPNAAATATLTALATNRSLNRWESLFTIALSEQRILSRDAAYRHPAPSQVHASLHNGPPANAADLAALLDEQLEVLASRIRHADSNDWRQFWNESAQDRDAMPKHEGQCRDAILSDLRFLLPGEVVAEREGNYANSRRADIKVICRDFHVPIEIKKHFHRDLWSSPRDQLIARYSADPATGGYGVFLALWFGSEIAFPNPPPSGAFPRSANELERRILSVLPAEHSRKVFVRVFDVSRQG